MSVKDTILEKPARRLRANLWQFWRNRSFWARVSLTFLIGLSVLSMTQSPQYDWRIKARGERKPKTPIVLIEIAEKPWNLLVSQTQTGWSESVRTGGGLSDGYFWNAELWEKLLKRILDAKVTAIGVSLFFGDNIEHRFVSRTDRPVFFDPRIVWAAELDSGGRPLVPIFASSLNANVGIKSMRADDDDILRRFSSQLVQLPHLSIRLAQLFGSAQGENLNPGQSNPIINFVGGKNVFHTIRFEDVLNDRFDLQSLKGKLVIIGPQQHTVDRFVTPLGPMSRAEVMANIVEQLIQHSEINRWPNLIYITILILFLFVGIRIVLSYPQSVALVFISLTCLLIAIGSVWAFDVIHVWIPVLAPTIMLVSSYVIFSSFQLNLREQRAWQIMQEQKYFSEVEQLKTNFMSMMSHDLKTPIAKIQAICDRLIANGQANLPDSTVNDIKLLRRSSDELNRYIQMILQVSKVETKNFRIHKEVIDLNETILKVLISLKPVAVEKGIVIETQLEPIFSIEADPTLIQEVIHNLVENALKYTNKGGGIRITSSEINNEVLFCCADTGPGIDPQDQAQIWQKFTRGQKADPSVQGSGLGLYLVKYFIELHGGRVFISSTVDQGTSIGFALPVT